MNPSHVASFELMHSKMTELECIGVKLVCFIYVFYYSYEYTILALVEYFCVHLKEALLFFSQYICPALFLRMSQFSFCCFISLELLHYEIVQSS